MGEAAGRDKEPENLRGFLEKGKKEIDYNAPSDMRCTASHTARRISFFRIFLGLEYMITKSEKTGWKETFLCNTDMNSSMRSQPET